MQFISEHRNTEAPGQEAEQVAMESEVTEVTEVSDEEVPTGRTKESKKRVDDSSRKLEFACCDELGQNCCKKFNPLW